MGKRYFCDYCDKTFPDNAHNRKKHLSGLQHQKLVKLHYQHFKDPEEILAEELSKTPCKKYLTNGSCSFYPNCRFSHLTPQWEQQLRKDIEDKKKRELDAQKVKEQEVRISEKSVEEWLSIREQKQKTENSKEHPITPSTTPSAVGENLSFGVSPVLRAVPDLPPSLHPPSVESLQYAEELEWG